MRWHISCKLVSMRKTFYVYLICFTAFMIPKMQSLGAEISIPFEDAEGLLWVQVEVPQSPHPLQFLFDTGAESSVINAETAASLGIVGGKEIEVQGVQTTVTGHWPICLAAKAGEIHLPEKFLSLDLSQLAHSCHRSLDGLLGADFIRGRIVQIDFARHQIRLLEKNSPAKSDIELPLKKLNQSFCVPVSINHHSKQWVRLDTGCATALQWVTSETIATGKSEKPAIGLAGISIPQVQTAVRFGSKEFNQIPTGIHRQAIFEGEAGLLGNDLLRHFKTVTIDAKSCHVVFSPM